MSEDKLAGNSQTARAQQQRDQGNGPQMRGPRPGRGGAGGWAAPEKPGIAAAGTPRGPRETPAPMGALSNASGLAQAGPGGAGSSRACGKQCGGFCKTSRALPGAREHPVTPRE